MDSLHSSSKLPILVSICIFISFLGLLMFMHKWLVGFNILFLLLFLFFTLICIILWIGNVIKDKYLLINLNNNFTTQAFDHCTKDNDLNLQKNSSISSNFGILSIFDNNIKISVALAIFTECILFAVLLASFIKSWLYPMPIIDGTRSIKGLWPPEGIILVDPWSTPFLNSLILMLSATSMTWANYSMQKGNALDCSRGLLITIFLGFSFFLLQIFEFAHLSFSFRASELQSIYSGNFYVINGFHGLHVIIGMLFIILCIIYLHKSKSNIRYRLGVEMTSWYWHFVDIIWIFIFLIVYRPF
jgi:cytochrome c oxidase subunit 3